MFENEITQVKLENSLLYILNNRKIHSGAEEKTLPEIYSGIKIMHRQEFSDDSIVYPTICFYLGDWIPERVGYGGLSQEDMPIYFEGYCLVKNGTAIDSRRSRQQARNMKEALGRLLVRYGGTFDIIDTSAGNTVIGGGQISEVRLREVQGTFNFSGNGIVTYYVVEGTETGN